MHPHPTTPSQRAPRPSLSGQYTVTSGTGKFTVMPIRGPRVGTAWLLSAFTLTLLGPEPSISENLNIDLLRNGQVIDNFFLPTGGNTFMTGNPGVASNYSMPHSYQSPFPVFDTDNLELRINFNMTLNPTYTYKWNGNLVYL